MPIIDDSNPIFRCVGRRVALALALAFPASSQAPAAYPNRPVKLVIPFPPGGPLDIVGRAIAQKLTEAWGQSVVVDNRPGAGGNIGADIVAKSAPDGYTILMGALSTHAVNPSLYAKMPYDAVKDFAPITLVAITPNVLVVNASLPVNSAKEFIAYAKANSGKLAFGSGSNGSAGHLAGELFKVDTGVDIVHVPYKGGAPATQALLAGDTQFMFDNLANAMPQVKAGKLKALAVTTAQALEARARAADDGGGRTAGLRHLDVVRPVRAGGHAEGRHREMERRGREDPQFAGHAREAPRARRRAGADDTGAVRGVHQERDPEVREDRQGIGREGGLKIAGRGTVVSRP